MSDQTKLKKLKYLKSLVVYIVIVMFFGSTVMLTKPAQAATPLPFNLGAKSAILVDAKTGKILYAKNADKSLPPASMTKLMTEYLVLKELDKGKIKLSTTVPVDSKVQDISRDTNFSGVPLSTSYPYTVDEMLKALLIPSSNAAAVAFANLISGNESNFVTLMNKTAKSLGMTETTYVNASGLDNVDIYHDLGSSALAQGGENGIDKTSARDLAILAYHIMNDFPPNLMSDINQITSMAQYKFKIDKDTTQTITNTNWMLPSFSQLGPDMKKYEYPGVDGFKTGFTSLAGYCFTGTVQQGDRRFISVVMGTKSEGDRFLQTKQLYDYGFKQISNQTIAKKGYTFKNKKTLPVTKGKQSSVNIALSNDVTLPLANGEKNNYKLVLHLNKSLLDKNGNLIAPVKKGQKVGYATVENTGNDNYGYIIGHAPQINVVTTSSVDKANWIVLLFRNIGGLVNGLFHHGK
ncbi:D-alanyl-D-alanine carboxypeptidase [Pullulanibacillus sp. KACC 23026]|uniref:D-alanyl-D-alanine carboxypeptidase family protein n=1 Tax=Pullulanibacillus sp. KACC 23026 TaxID=3028315 RepID=UPI0023B14EB8|nr:D-alanyl-D-alanine carboxypeptidase family protein [Pullulanibacillus sp. KACC 23026]WEG12774.1 D-alanyl-D-alanine carboxypeptidase [Pullulanibacillus sp. KACC 23026]